MITFAGIPLTLADVHGELQAWIDRYLPFEDLRDQSISPSLRTNRPQARSEYGCDTGLTLPNYPSPPRPKLNSLYWPTGASRWSRGYFLATTDQVNAIKAALSASNTSANLVLKDENSGVTITAAMYLLQPRVISSSNASSTEQQLLLLPLVDERYYWQYRQTGNFTVGNSTTWANLYSTLGTQLGVTINADSVHASYYKPDIEELTRRYENCALLLDAVAHSCGQRIVRQPDGTVASINWTSSATRYAANAASFTLVAGAQNTNILRRGIVPASVLVTLPKWRQSQVDPNGDLFTVSTSSPISSTTGTVKTIHSTAFADFSNKNTDPDNLSDCQALAARIAADYYGSLEYQYDVSHASLKSWTLSGYDDHVEWCFGRVEPLKPSELRDEVADDRRDQGDPVNRPWGEYQAYTRVQSPPYNFGDEEQLQNFPNLLVYRRLARFSLTETLAPGLSAAAVFVDDATGTILKSDVLTVFDPEGRAFGFVGEQGWAEYKNDSLRWEFVAMEGCLLRHATAAADIAANATGDVTITDGVHTITVSAKNWSGSDITNGDKVGVFYEPGTATWYILPSTPGTDKGAIVKITSANAGVGCVWDAVVAVPDVAATGYCVDPFAVGDACKVMVLNSDTGSLGTKAALNVNEYYLARRIGNANLGGLDVYAIRNEMQTDPLTRFEMTAELVLGAEPVAANARVLTWQAGDWRTDDNDAITVVDMTRATWEARAPGYARYRGWCRRMTDSSKYEIVWMQQTARAINFDYGGIGSVVTAFYQGVNPGVAVEVVDNSSLFRGKLDGAKGMAIFAPEDADGRGRYNMIECESKAGFVIVLCPVGLGVHQGPNFGFLLEEGWWGSQQDVLQPHATKVVVQDTIGLWRYTIEDDTPVVASYDAVNDRYYPILANQETLSASALAAGDVDPDDPGLTTIDLFDPETPFPFSANPNVIGSFNPLQFMVGASETITVAFSINVDGEGHSGYYISGCPPHNFVWKIDASGAAGLPSGSSANFDLPILGVKSVENIGQASINSGDKIVVFRSDRNHAVDDPEFFCFKPGVSTTTITVVTDVTWDGTSLKVTKQQVKVIETVGSPVTTTVLTPASATVVENVFTSGTNLKETTKTIKVFADGSGSDSTVDAGDACT